MLGVGTNVLAAVGAAIVFVGIVMIALEESVVKRAPRCISNWL